MPHPVVSLYVDRRIRRGFEQIPFDSLHIRKALTTAQTNENLLDSVFCVLFADTRFLK